MYRNIGDAPAYALVRDHFAILTEVVRNHHGTVVKTIGDAVMACFSRVDEALDAVRDMNRKLADDMRAVPLTLKASLHAGPCLAVNANDRLDFFGTTINLASRMVSCCQGGDLVVSDEIYHRPEMREFLKSVTPRRSWPMSNFADSVIPDESGAVDLGLPKVSAAPPIGPSKKKQQGRLTLFLLGFFENQFHLCSETSGVNLAIFNIA